ncbi:MAG: IS701 family transposase [Bryobacteraceae bacterium]|nr:IS701 family transposase [Bryobacteraceae bacterium]
MAKAAGHADRHGPLKAYCAGLLLPGERKSVEPMAARLAPENVRRTHQSLHHLVADAPWSDEAVLGSVREHVLAAMKQNGPVVAWIVDDTGFLKKGTHSVGVARQYCGQVGKQDNCRVAVSLSVATCHASLPIAWRLYLPESWANDQDRRKETGIPDEVHFQTKPAIALAQIRRAAEQGVSRGPVLADSAYGNETRFREGITELELTYTVGVHENMTVWPPGEAPRPKPRRKGRGRPPTRLQRDAEHQPVAAKELAVSLPDQVWKTVAWREGTRHKLKSRFAAVRVRPAHRDHNRSEPYPEEWLLVEWPASETEPTKYWLSTLPPRTRLTALVRLAKHRWIIERDYEELKQELGLGHYEGRGWRGFHHHATLCIAAYGFLVIERTRFSPSARAGRLELRAARIPPEFQPRGSPRARRTA